MTEERESLIVRASAGSRLPTHPDGQFPATCIDVIDKGMVLSKKWNKEQHRGILRFFCGEWAVDPYPDDPMDERFGGWRFNAHGKREIPLWVDAWFTLTLSPKGDLGKFIQKWRGQPFTDEQLKGFELMDVLHVNAFLQLSHNATAEKTYVNIDSVMKLPAAMKEQAPGIPDNYIRVSKRPKDGEQQKKTPQEEEDSDLPF